MCVEIKIKINIYIELYIKIKNKYWNNIVLFTTILALQIENYIWRDFCTSYDIYNFQFTLLALKSYTKIRK